MSQTLIMLGASPILCHSVVLPCWEQVTPPSISLLQYSQVQLCEARRTYFSAGGIPGNEQNWDRNIMNHIKQTEGKEPMKCSKGYRSDRDKPDGEEKCGQSGRCWVEVLLAPDSCWRLSPGFSQPAKPTAGEPAVVSPWEQRQWPGSGCSYRKWKL